MKIYIVTSGEYSDYHIEAVFTKKELAEKFCALHNSTESTWGYFNYIEEYDADQWDCDGKVSVHYLYEFYIGKETGKFEEYDDPIIVRRRKEVIKTDGLYYHIILTIDQDDMEKAKKIAQDKYWEWKFLQI